MILSSSHKNNLRNVFNQLLNKNTDLPLFYEEMDVGWKKRTISEFIIDVELYASWLLSKGIKKGDRVAIATKTSYKWVLLDKAIILAGGISVGLDLNLANEEVEHILNDSKPIGFFYSDEESLDVIKSNYECEYWTQNTNKNIEHTRTDEFPDLNSNDDACIVYTSGSTGLPKGVAYTQNHLFGPSQDFKSAFNQYFSKPNQTINWLPLHNSTGRFVLEANFVLGIPQYFIRNPKEIMDVSKITNPTYLVVVPRVLEKIYEGVQNKLSNANYFLKSLFNIVLMISKIPFLPRKIKELIIIGKLKRKLFGNSINFLICGSAPIDKKILSFFEKIGIPVYEAYGMTEAGGLITMNTPKVRQLGSVGAAFGNTKLKTNEDGELLVKNEYVCRQYFNSDIKIVDEEGYLKTGDIVNNVEGKLYIMGKNKEIIKTSTGQRMSPVYIENCYKRIPEINQIVVFGDNQKFLTAIISLADNNKNEDISYEKIKHKIENISRSLPINKRIVDFRILPRELSIKHGEITPSLKLKRNKISQNYSSLISDMYLEKA